ncbi:MAG: MBL fold metallo-hydrolase [bacterium]
MRPDILPCLVNGPEGDPAVYAAFKYERRAFLFDLGDLCALSARSLLKVTHCFVSHTHVDHFIGFDQILRLHLGREKTLVIYGPPGFVSNVEGKLKGYSWNLVQNYPYDFRLEAHELGPGRLRAAAFGCREAFVSRPLARPAALEDGDVILDEPGLQVRASLLEHDIPCLAYVLEEKQHINVDKVRLEALGVRVGPWIRHLKEAIQKGEPDDLDIAVAAGERGPESPPRRFKLGKLRKDVIRITRGQKIGYVTDAAFTDANVEKIVRLCRGADILFCEAAFSERERARARERRHLTAHQAGVLAREAGAVRLVVFHFSPKYHTEPGLLLDEAAAAFGKAVE